MTEAHGLRLSMRARIAAFTRTVGLSGALLTLLMLLATAAPSAAGAASQGEAGATKRKIEAVKGEIKSLQDDIAADQGRKADAQQALGRLDREVRTVVLGHLQRGGTPTSFDRTLATQFGAHAVRLVHEGRFGQMVCYRPPHIESVPIAEAIRNLSTVDPHGSAVQAARALGIGFGDAADSSPFA